jgi:hypothetical protein
MIVLSGTDLGLTDPRYAATQPIAGCYRDSLFATGKDEPVVEDLPLKSLILETVTAAESQGIDNHDSQKVQSRFLHQNHSTSQFAKYEQGLIWQKIEFL